MFTYCCFLLALIQIRFEYFSWISLLLYIWLTVDNLPWFPRCLLVMDVLMVVAAKYFEEISQDTGKYCFGVVDTLKALECGAVEILICWENLDLVR